MSLQVEDKEPDAIIRKLERINQKMNQSFIRDYGGLSVTSAFFMSLPIPCWIKVVDRTTRSTKFNVVQSNYSYFDAYGIRPEENWDERLYYSRKEVESFNQSDLSVLDSKSRKPLVFDEHIYNANLGKPEKLTVCKWAINYGETSAVAGAVIDPSYIQHIMDRMTHDTGINDFKGMPDTHIIARMEKIVEDLDRARRNVAANSELIKRFFNNSPLPMWICQYIGAKSSPQKARFPIAQYSAGFKNSGIETSESEKLAAVKQSIIENGHDVRVRKKPDDANNKRINWPIFMNAEIIAVGGVQIKLAK